MKIEDLSKLRVNKKVCDDSLDVLYEYLLENNIYGLNISKYITDANRNLQHILSAVYAEDIYSNIKRASNDPQVISFVNSILDGKDYIFNFDKFIDMLLNEYIMMNSEFKTSKGSDSAIKYAYNLTAKSNIQPELTDDAFKITWGTAANPNQPFYLQIDGFLLPFIYESVVKSMAHPVGFGYEYFKSILLDWVDYPTSDISTIWNKVEIRGVVNGQLETIIFYQKAENGNPQIGNIPLEFKEVVHQDGTKEKVVKLVDPRDGKTKIINSKSTPKPHIIITDEQGNELERFDDRFELITDYNILDIFRIKDLFEITNQSGIPIIDIVPRPTQRPLTKIGGHINGTKQKLGNFKITDTGNFGDARPNPATNYDDFKSITYRGGYLVPNRDETLVCLDRQDGITSFRHNINDSFNNTYPAKERLYQGFGTIGSRKEPIYHMATTDLRVSKAGGELVDKTKPAGGINAEVWDVTGLDTIKGTYQTLNGIQVISTTGTPYEATEGFVFKFEVDYDQLSGSGFITIAELTSGTQVFFDIGVYYSPNGMYLYVNSSKSGVLKGRVEVYVKIILSTGEIEVTFNDINKKLTAPIRTGKGWDLTLGLSKSKILRPNSNRELRDLVEDLVINLKDIDTSQVTDFSRIFEDTQGYELHRTDYSGCENWTTAQVTTLASLCKGNKKFNHNINSWNTSNVTTMNSTFMGATNFNQPLDKWDTSKVTNMDSMFEI